MTVTITQDVRNVAGVASTASWAFTSPTIRNVAGKLITQERVPVKPVNGILTVELEPGIATVEYNDTVYIVTVPDADADLFSLLASAIASPPSATGAALDAAIAQYLADNPFAGGGGMAAIAEDLTPQLGGDLDVNGHDVGPLTAAQLTILHTAIAAIQALSGTNTGDQDLSGYQQVNTINTANGYAGLDGMGKVQSAQLPSYVDDVLDFANLGAFPSPGEAGKIYIAEDSNWEYRWNAGTSAYIRIVASPGSTDALAQGTTNLYSTPTNIAAAIHALTSKTTPSNTDELIFTDSQNAFAPRKVAYSDLLAAMLASVPAPSKSTVGLGNVDNVSEATILAAAAAAVPVILAPGTNYAEIVPGALNVVPRLDIGTANVGLSSGAQHFTFFTSPISKTIVSIRDFIGGNPSASGTLARIGLYSVDSAGVITLIASTPNLATLWDNAFAYLTKALSASVAITAGSRYALSKLFIGASSKPFFYSATVNGNEQNVNPALCGTLTAQTDLVSSTTTAALSVSTARFCSQLITA